VRIIRVGPDAALVEVASSHEAVSLAAWARSRRLARDAVPGAETVLLDGLREALVDPGALAAGLAHWHPEVSTPGPEVEVAVTYDGPDLESVARLWGCDVAEVVRRHQATTFESAFCGFAPGFAYLAATGPGLPEVPRLATPRTRVPAGSVALAGRWCGVYPVASPGGWQIIASTDAVLWDPDRPEPALLAPGTRVRFGAAS
jgi:KipI family sensor histidine kinase inhibitor